MKPENYKKESSKRRSNARAKMYLRSQLSWLWGYPIVNGTQNTAEASTLLWRSLYFPTPWEMQTININGQRIASTLYNRNKLIRDFPKALPRLIGDVSAWSEHIKLKLDAIKLLVEGKDCDPWDKVIAPLASRRVLEHARRMKTQYPEFISVLTQFGWWLSADLTLLSRALTWIEQEAETLKKIIKQNHSIDDLILKLFFLQYQAGHKNCSSLLQLLQTSAWETAYPQQLSWVETPGIVFLKPIETQNLIEPIGKWLDHVLASSQRDIRLRTRVISFLLPCEVITTYEERWRLIGEIPKIIHAQTKQEKSRKPWQQFLASESDYQQQINNRLTQIQLLPAPILSTSLLRKVIVWFAQHPKIFAGLEALIQAIHVDKLEDNSPWKTPCLPLFIACSWYRSYRKLSDKKIRRLINFIPHMIRFVEADHQQNKQQKRLALLVDILDDQEPNKKDLFAEIFFYYSKASLSGLAMFVDRVNGTIDHSLAADIAFQYDDLKVEKSIEWDDYIVYANIFIAAGIKFTDIYDDTWKYLHTIAQHDEKKLIACLTRWGKLTDNDTEQEWEAYSTDLLPIAALLYNQGFGYVADHFADKKDFALLRQCSRYLETYDEIHLEIPQIKGIPKNDKVSWQHYPAELHDALRLLERMRPKAEHVAQQHLSDYFPSTDSLAKEIQFLQNTISEKLAKGIDCEALQNRLRKQQHRLHHPITVSPAVFKKLNAKLIHAAYSSLLHDWYTNLHDTLCLRVRDKFALASLPKNSLGNPRHITALIGFLPLEKKTQAIAKQLLHTRLQEAPWDLRDEPRNAKFLQELSKRGIQTKPWLDGIGKVTQTVMDANEQTMTLHIDFETDPLEIFHMGRHFKTCLSIFNFNYFSVVANAADINKRVVYLKNDKQKIVGRCLFALNNQGHLLTFFPYSHLKGDIISAAINDFADQLAAKMHTVRSDVAPVSTLVAHRWYDDGAEKTQASYLEFTKDTSFQKQLLTLPLSKANQTIEALFTNKVLETFILVDLLQLDAFEQRPELATGLLDRIKALRTKDYRIRYVMAKALFTCGQTSVALSFMKQWKLVYRYQEENGCYSYPYDEVELLITLNPTLAYKALIESRGDYVEGNDDDQDIKRIEYLAQIHTLLYRPRKALNCYQAILSKGNLSHKKRAEVIELVTRLKSEHSIRL